jgi:hypothetical protein
VTQIVLYGTLFRLSPAQKKIQCKLLRMKNIFQTLFVLLYVVILIIGYGTLYYYCRCYEIFYIYIENKENYCNLFVYFLLSKLPPQVILLFQMKSKRKMLKSVENMLPPLEDEVANKDKNPPNRMSKRKRGQSTLDSSISPQKGPFKKTRTNHQAQETGNAVGRCHEFDCHL